MPRSYVPTLVALKLPELMLALGFCGLGGAVIAAARGDPERSGVGRRAALLAVVLAAVLPVAVTVAARPAMYNGIRHFVFLMPPFAVLGGLAGAVDRATPPPLRANRDGRGRRHSASPVSLPRSSKWCGCTLTSTRTSTMSPEALPGRGRASCSTTGDCRSSRPPPSCATSWPPAQENPRDATWTVAVCGPHPAAVVALGPQYSAIWDPKGADFAMMLGEFYCAKLDAPVLFDIVREGVVYARVYDIRGRSITTLLTVRGPDS